jgi:spore coat protein A, manganese oxidase
MQARGVTRRQVLKAAGVAGAALAVPWEMVVAQRSRRAFAFYQSMGLQKFVQPLRGVGPGGIPVAVPDLFRAPVTGVAHYSISIGQFTDRLHPELHPTTLWGYNPARHLGGGTQLQKHLGGIIVAQRGVPIQVTFNNNLPAKHILPVDTSADFPDAKLRQNAATIHLHGGLVPWISDGGPFTWFTPGPNGDYGPSVHSKAGNVYKRLNPNLKPGQAEYYYPNDQSARLVWYHDHAHDLTRLNVYAGTASVYIIRDQFESSLRNLGLPDFVENGGREIPIAIQDKIFVGSDIRTKDPTWPGSTTVGSLWYPHTYEPNRWQLGPPADPPDPSIIPEMFGDTMLANGTVYPEATVDDRLYRLRVLNACQARFLNLQLYVDDGSTDGITLLGNTPQNRPGPDFLVIGTEGGFLVAPVLVPSNRPFNPATLGGSLITAPAERWDLLLDFSGFAGKKIILYNDAPAPFPGGDPVNDYFPGSPGNPTQPNPGFGPNTRQIMRFKVVHAASKDTPVSITERIDLTSELTPFPVPPGVSVQHGVLHLPPGVTVRQLTLNEAFDGYGRLIQLLGTNVKPDPDQPGFGRAYKDPATETPMAGSTEIWQIANLTGDTHPIHFHLVNVLVLARQPFDAAKYDGAPSYTGPARGPKRTELGWKETVSMNPDEVTTVIMRFDLPKVPFVVPSSPRTGGNEYVWHCHILEHEEHDMMRPLVVS